MGIPERVIARKFYAPRMDRQNKNISLSCDADYERYKFTWEEGVMNNGHSLLRAFKTIGLILTLGVSMSANAGLFGFGGKHWKEEVLLHDGRKIIAERVQHLGGRPTLESRERRILDETITFSPPGTNQKIVWSMSFRDDVPDQNGVNVVLLGIVNNIPYIAGYPAGCIAYNKWKRPNPPQILFKYEAGQWKRITLAEFPPQLIQANVIVGGPPAEGIKSFYSVEQVNAENYDIDEGPYRTILREPVKGEKCPQYSSGPKAPIPILPDTSPK